MNYIQQNADSWQILLDLKAITTMKSGMGKICLLSWKGKLSLLFLLLPV